MSDCAEAGEEKESAGEVDRRRERRGPGWLAYEGGIYPVVYTLARRQESRRPAALEDLPEISGTVDLTALGDNAGPLAMRIRDDEGEQWLILEDGEELQVETVGTNGRLTVLRYESAGS